MSVVIHGDNFIELHQGQVVRNVGGSTGDTITIKFNGRYFVPGQYSSYVTQLIMNRHIVTPQVNQNIVPGSWLGVWKHFTNNQEARVMCCVCNERTARVGGHVVFGNQDRVVEHGSNSVFIIPICETCNGRQNEGLNINRDIRAVKLFNYYNGYYGDSFDPEEEHGIRIMHIRISPQRLQQIQNAEQRAGAHYGEIDRQGRQGQAGQGRQQGRQGRQEPQAGQARRPIYYNNRNAYR